MDNRTIEIVCIVGMLLCALLVVGHIYGTNDQMANGLNASGIINQSQSTAPTQTVEEYRQQSPARRQPQITYENDLPAGVSREGMRRDREAQRPALAYDRMWTSSGDWTKDPLFTDPRSDYYVGGDGTKDSDYKGRLWRKSTGFSKYPLDGRGR